MLSFDGIPQSAILDLAAKGLTTSDINALVVTHGHSDHYGHASAFPSANLVDDYFFTQGSVFAANGLFQVRKCSKALKGPA